MLAELLGGAPWEEVADGDGLTAEQMRARFGHTLHQWRQEAVLPDPGATGEFSPGMPNDPDPVGSAAALDAWIERHAEPWLAARSRPVTRAISKT